jgi:YidC/Oxa1 family membrane protein insertase
MKLVTETPGSNIEPIFEVIKGSERVKIDKDGTIEALAPGEVTIEATIPGIAAKTGFLFIKALGRVGVMGDDGTINLDILAMVLFFGVSIYLNQELSGSSGGGAQQQQAVNKITPVIFSGMFLFFPLPAGVLMYIVVANVFQTLQTVILMREPLPENLQKLVAQQEKAEKIQEALPFEKRSKKKMS